MYTIASSPLAAPDQVHICAALVSRPLESLETAVAALVAKAIFPSVPVPTRTDRWFGLCSQWLCTRARPGESVLVRLRPSAFKLTSSDARPLMMIGAGAGIAPFRAMWSELAVQDSSVAVPTDPPGDAPPRRPAVLFFGCQHPEHDWLYRAEMGTVSAEGGALSTVFTAFSRMGEEGIYDAAGNCGEYVQDQLRAHSTEVRELLLDGAGTVQICGNSRMGSSVLEALGAILGAEGLQRMRTEDRIIQELWGEGAPRSLDVSSLEGGTASGEASLMADDSVVQLSKDLLESVKNGNQQEVQRLLAAGADVNFQPGSRKYARIGLRQEAGETALHWAALRGDDIIAEWLLAANSDPDLRDQDGKSPLHIAAFNGVHDVSERLLLAKCNPDAQDLRGNTPLQWVVLAGGSMRMVKLLLKYNARGDIENSEGDNVADVAEELGSMAVANLVRKAIDARAD